MKNYTIMHTYQSQKQTKNIIQQLLKMAGFNAGLYKNDETIMSTLHLKNFA